ncbi:hypothetical protein TorRG33x02_235290, partial [Trema orientale]
DGAYESKYFPNSDFLYAKVGYAASYAWRSIIWGADLFKQGVRWRVGDGSKIRLFSDLWQPRPSTFKAITPMRGSDFWFVEDIISNRKWNLDLINHMLFPIERFCIESIPLGYSVLDDKLLWHCNSSAIYSVRFGYKLAMASMVETGPQLLQLIRLGGSVFGTSESHQKSKFMRRVFHKILPTRAALKNRHVDIDVLCPWCKKEIKGGFHAFWHCDRVAGIWSGSCFGPALSRFIGSGTNLSSKIVPGLTLLLIIMEEAGSYLSEFQECFKIETLPPSCRLAVDPRWKPPDAGLLKLNTDAAFSLELNTIGIGIVVRDFRGQVLGCASISLAKASSPFVAELLAFKEGQRFAINNGFQIGIAEFDASNVIKAILSNSIAGIEEPIVSDIKKLLKFFGS